MYRRPLADVQKAFSRLFQQNVHRYTHGLSELSGRCTDTTMWMSVTAPASQTDRESLLPVPCVWACLEGRTTSQ
jgi:hypothetical protein